MVEQNAGDIGAGQRVGELRGDALQPLRELSLPTLGIEQETPLEGERALGDDRVEPVADVL